MKYCLALITHNLTNGDPDFNLEEISDIIWKIWAWQWGIRHGGSLIELCPNRKTGAHLFTFQQEKKADINISFFYLVIFYFFLFFDFLNYPSLTKKKVEEEIEEKE